MRKIVIIIIVIGLIISLIGCSKSSDVEESVVPVVETTQSPTVASSGDGSGSLLLKQDYKLAIFAGETLQGTSHGPEVLKKQSLTMMNVWTTTCPYCIEEMPMLEVLSAELVSEGVQIIGVIGDGKRSAKAAQNIIDTTGVTYLNLVPTGATEKIIFDIAYAVPTTLFVDQNGRVIGEPILGVRSKEEYTALAREALKSL